MRHGVVSIADDASLVSVARAMSDHRVHAILIEQRSTGRPILIAQRSTGRPLGWAKADTLLGWLNMRSPWVHAQHHRAGDDDRAHATVREAIFSAAADGYVACWSAARAPAPVRAC
jgi:hypothetical protein